MTLDGEEETLKRFPREDFGGAAIHGSRCCRNEAGLWLFRFLKYLEKEHIDIGIASVELRSNLRLTDFCSTLFLYIRTHSL